MNKDIAASVRARLLKLAKIEGSDFDQILVRFALERMLYRLSQSAHADRFLLKGALLFALWYDQPHRHTRDADLLGLGASDLASVAQAFREIVSIHAEDGIEFLPDSLHTEPIREHARYVGARILIGAELARARCKIQVDVGFGDAITPAPIDAVYPVLLNNLPAPTLRTYSVYTVIAEKLNAIVALGMANTRLKDYYDLYVLLDREVLEGSMLSAAVNATFCRRGMAVGDTIPVGLTEEFSEDPSRQAIWKSFLRKNEIAGLPLPAMVATIGEKLHFIFH